MDVRHCIVLRIADFILKNKGIIHTGQFLKAC